MDQPKYKRVILKLSGEALSGEIETKTKLGEGSTFIVRLPLTLAIIQALMVVGRIEKYYKEVCLVDQAFIKSDDGEAVSKLLKKANAEVVRFVRFEMGEGLEKKNEDFAAEVAAQIKG